MILKGLHLLLTYQCNYECDHCFVWGSPKQLGTMSLQKIRHILTQAQELGTVQRIYFEGGEPFLYYAVLLKGVEQAAQMGFSVGIVSNGYWATEEEDAIEWLRPFAGVVQDLSISTDLYHYDEQVSRNAQNARSAAAELDIPVGLIQIAQPEATSVVAGKGQLPPGESAVMYRGRATKTLVQRVVGMPGEQFTCCPHEDLGEPGRVHVDPMGHVHICQGISLGNLFVSSLKEICAGYIPESHPITGPLLQGGPMELARRYDIPTAESYADACHFCYQTRVVLREEFPQILLPGQMYGDFPTE
jgi:MoaA/NifB/PqqE/SkfB family radical SAM enzyme